MIPKGFELRRLLLASSGDPDLLDAFEQLVSMMAVRAEAVDNMEPVSRLNPLEAQISVAHQALRYRSGEQQSDSPEAG